MWKRFSLVGQKNLPKKYILEQVYLINHIYTHTRGEVIVITKKTNAILDNLSHQNVNYVCVKMIYHRSQDKISYETYRQIIRQCVMQRHPET